MFFTFCSFKMGWNPLIFLTFLLEMGGSMRLWGAVRQQRHAQSLSGSRMLLGMHQSLFKKFFECNRCFNFLTAPPDWTNSVFHLNLFVPKSQPNVRDFPYNRLGLGDEKVKRSGVLIFSCFFLLKIDQPHRKNGAISEKLVQMTSRHAWTKDTYLSNIR